MPVLFMRTLIQTLLVYPDLTKYAMSILETLIFGKEIWKNKHLWEGFKRCCTMTQPESYAVLCKLGRPELEDVLITKPELREPLLDYALDANVRPYVLDVLKGVKSEKKKEKKQQSVKRIKTEPESKKRFVSSHKLFYKFHVHQMQNLIHHKNAFLL